MDERQLRHVQGNRAPRSLGTKLGRLAASLLDRLDTKAAHHLERVVCVLSSHTDGFFCEHCTVGPLQNGILTIQVDDVSSVAAIRLEWGDKLPPIIAGNCPRLHLSGGIRFKAGRDGLPLCAPPAPAPHQTRTCRTCGRKTISEDYPAWVRERQAIHVITGEAPAWVKHRALSVMDRRFHTKRCPLRNTDKTPDYLRGTSWALFRAVVLIAAQHKCVDCEGDAVIVHHLHYRTVLDETLFDVVPLCDPCHKKRHGRTGAAFDDPALIAHLGIGDKQEATA